MPALTAGISVLHTELGIAEVLYEGQEQIAVAGLGNAKRTSGSRNSSSTWMSCKGGVCAVCAINPCLLLKRFHFLLLLVVSVSILCIKIAFWLPGQVKSETGSLASCPHFTTLPQFVLVSETTQTGQNWSVDKEKQAVVLQHVPVRHIKKCTIKDPFFPCGSVCFN